MSESPTITSTGSIFITPNQQQQKEGAKFVADYQDQIVPVIAMSEDAIDQIANYNMMENWFYPAASAAFAVFLALGAVWVADISKLDVQVQAVIKVTTVASLLLGILFGFLGMRGSGVKNRHLERLKGKLKPKP
jgi:hypothetical protein